MVSSLKIKSDIDSIWSILECPENMPAWNPKCLSTTCKAKVVAGDTFEAVFKMSKKQHASCEVITVKPAKEITIRYSGDAFKDEDCYIEESFSLKAIGVRETEVTLVVDFSNSGLPRWVKCFIWFVSRFGRKSGRDSLDGLADLVKYKGT